LEDAIYVWLGLGLALVLRLVRFSFSDRVGAGLPDVEWVYLYGGDPTCSHSLSV